MTVFHNKKVCYFECEFCEQNPVSQKDTGINDNTETIENMDISRHKVENRIECNFCKKEYKNKNELMLHKKNDHSKNVSNCWNFISGVCEFNDHDCWFKHPKNEAELNERVFKCNICVENFSKRIDFMEHRKSNHDDLIPRCKYEKNGLCSYGLDKCWFKHEQSENKIENIEKDKNMTNENDTIQRIFKIMEEMSQRIVKIENEKNT